MSNQIQALIAQRIEIDQQIQRMQENAVASALDAAEQALDEAGVHPETVAAYFHSIRGKKHFFGGAPVPKKGGKASTVARTAGTKVAPKYRHKTSGATWSGRGKQPRWFVEADQADIEHLVSDAGSAPA